MLREYADPNDNGTFPPNIQRWLRGSLNAIFNLYHTPEAQLYGIMIMVGMLLEREYVNFDHRGAVVLGNQVRLILGIN
jgi:hypothetical protein